MASKPDRNVTAHTEEPISPGLYVVATPIGNLADLGGRARAVLASADAVACEDTRISGKLLRAYDIATPMTAYHDHNADRVRPKLIERLERGETLALISDAGTPLISDPGYKLVRAAREAGVDIFAVPGPSAAIAALSIAGLPTDRFFFAGFLPQKAGARRKALEELKTVPGTLVFYETGPRLQAALSDMRAILGAREAAVAREMTKRFEEVTQASLDDLVARSDSPPKGELVILLGPAQAPQPDQAAIDEALKGMLRDHSVREAAQRVAEKTGAPRRAVYQRALALKDGAGGQDKP